MLVDFGISKVINSPDEMLKTVIGSPGYTAPEILRRVPYGKEVDMYSCGVRSSRGTDTWSSADDFSFTSQVITFTLIAGYSPFYFAQDSTAMADAVVTGRWKFEAPEWTNISAECKDFIKKLMLINPKNRMTAHQAMEHIWLKTNCPPGYIEHLQKMNDHCISMEYKALGMEPPAHEPVAAAEPATGPAAAAAASQPVAEPAAVAATAEAVAEVAKAAPTADTTPYPAARTDSAAAFGGGVIETMKRYPAPEDAQNLLDIHAISAETRKSRWHSAAKKALMLKTVDLMFQSVHIKHALNEAAAKATSPASGTPPAATPSGEVKAEDAQPHSDEEEGKAGVRIDSDESINRKVFKYAPSAEAIAAYEKLMADE